MPTTPASSRRATSGRFTHLGNNGQFVVAGTEHEVRHLAAVEEHVLLVDEGVFGAAALESSTDR